MITDYLKKAIRANIIAAVPTDIAPVGVYFGQAPADHGQRYIVFNLEELSNEDGRVLCELELNCLDYGADSTTCENLTDTMKAAFDHSFYENANLAYEAYAEKRNPVRQEDRKIIWRRTTFALYYYDKE